MKIRNFFHNNLSSHLNYHTCQFKKSQLKYKAGDKEVKALAKNFRPRSKDSRRHPYISTKFRPFHRPVSKLKEELETIKAQFESVKSNGAITVFSQSHHKISTRCQETVKTLENILAQAETEYLPQEQMQRYADTKAELVAWVNSLISLKKILSSNL